MRIVFIIFMWTFCNVSQGQVRNLTSCRDTSISQHVIVLGGVGIVFKPFNELSNKPNSVLCDAYEEEFYLNDLRIDKEIFINLKLSSQQLSNDNTNIFNRSPNRRGYGTYKYIYNIDSDCASKIIFRVDTKIPIFLNGIKLDILEQKEKLSLIEPDNIITIIRKYSFYKIGKIEITTKKQLL